MKTYKILLFCIFVILLSACANNQVYVHSESDVAFAGYPTEIPDDTVYEITGITVTDVDQLTRQISPARGSAFVYGSSGTTYGSASYVGPVINGKSFLHIYIKSISPNVRSFTALPGDIVLVKGTDTKLSAVLPGTEIQVKCKVQNEVVAATTPGEELTPAHSTFEFDYCRMDTPVIKLVGTPSPLNP